MQITVKTKESYKTTAWSGGLTTELYLYPESGDYASRNFAVRISSATVELEHSIFTPLPGIHRELMLLEGEMKLLHRGHRERVMQPLVDIDSFPGDWQTESEGKVTDFNLMTQQGAEGKLYAVEATEPQLLELPISEKQGEQKLVLYAISGSGKINDHKLGETELMVIDAYANEPLALEPEGEAPLRLAVSQLLLPR